MKIWEAEHGDLLHSLQWKASTGNFGGVWDPDGKFLAYITGKAVKVFSPAGDEVRTLVGPEGFLNALALSRDGTRLAAASPDGTVTVWDPAGGPPLQVLR